MKLRYVTRRARIHTHIVREQQRGPGSYEQRSLCGGLTPYAVVGAKMRAWKRFAIPTADELAKVDCDACLTRLWREVL